MELKNKQPYFKIFNVGHKYYIFLKHGHRYTRYFGKIVERCTSPCGVSYTMVSLKFNRLAKLHLSKGINFFNSMDSNLKLKLKEKDWFRQFQKIVLVGASSVDLNETPYANYKTRVQATKRLVRSGRPQPSSKAVTNRFENKAGLYV